MSMKYTLTEHTFLALFLMQACKWMYLQVVVIAHRLETVLTAERIFLLNDGKLQQLSHSALVNGQFGSVATGLVI